MNSTSTTINPTRPQALRAAQQRAEIEEERGERKRTSPPFSTRDERFYRRLVEVSRVNLSPRLLWRLHRATPVLKSERMADMLDRVWLVPSSRRHNISYRVDLKNACCTLPDGEICPDKTFNKKTRCAHYEAAILAESQYIRDFGEGTFATELQRARQLRAA